VSLTQFTSLVRREYTEAERLTFDLIYRFNQFLLITALQQSSSWKELVKKWITQISPLSPTAAAMVTFNSLFVASSDQRLWIQM
jgi:hypothetical protein